MILCSRLVCLITLCSSLSFFLYQRNVVEVEWIETHNKNLYRAGYKGKVDILYTYMYTNTGVCFKFIITTMYSSIIG